MEHHDKKVLADMIRFYGLNTVLKEIVLDSLKLDEKSPERACIVRESANKKIQSATLKIVVD